MASRQSPISITLKADGVSSVTSALRGVKETYLDLEKQISAAGEAGASKRTAAAQRELKGKLGSLREEAKLLREVSAARAAEYREAAAKRAFDTATGRGNKSVFGAFTDGKGMDGMMRAAGATGLAIGVFSSAINLASASLRQFSGFVINEVLRPMMALQTRSIQIANNSGGKLSSEGVLGSARAIALRNNLDPQAVLEAAGKFQDKTGEPGMGLSMMGTLATLSKGRGLDMGDLSEMSASLYRNGTKKEDLDRILLALTAQGEAGSVPLRELSKLGGKLTAPAEKLGGSWFTKVATANAILQTSRRTGFGSVEEAATGLQSFVGDSLRLGKNISPASFSKAGGVESIADPIHLLGDFYRKTKGNMTTLHGMGFSEPAAKLISSYQGTFVEAQKAAKAGGATEAAATEAGASAVEGFIRALSTANTTMSEEEQKRDATMGTSGERFEAGMARIKAAIFDHTPELEHFVNTFAEHAGEIGDASVVLAQMLLGLAGAAVEVLNWFGRLTKNHGEGDVLRTVMDKGGNTNFPAMSEPGYWRKGEGVFEYMMGQKGVDTSVGMPGQWKRVGRNGQLVLDNNAKAPTAGPMSPAEMSGQTQAEEGQATTVLGGLPLTPAELAQRSVPAIDPVTPGSHAAGAAAAQAQADAAEKATKLAASLEKAAAGLDRFSAAAELINRSKPFTDR